MISRTQGAECRHQHFYPSKNLHYGFDFCPAFWDWLIASNTAGYVFSIDKVRAEIRAGDDERVQWAEDRGDDFFLLPNPPLLAALDTVTNWVGGQNYEPAAIATFLQDADYYLVAYALAHQHAVVTHEIVSASTKRVKIPNVCIGLNIRFLSPYEMLRCERARFILGPAR